MNRYDLAAKVYNEKVSYVNLYTFQAIPID